MPSTKTKNAVRDMTPEQRRSRRQKLEALKRDLTMEDLYTCPECGSHELLVEREYRTTTEVTSTLPSDCHGAEDGVAAVIIEEHIQVMRQWGTLDADHRPQWDEGETETVDTDRGDGSKEIHCSQCVEDADGSDWDTEEGESEEDKEEWFVRCGACNREVEFGWSHEDRGGRIWPTECGDFIPGRSWPEARYIDSWGEQGFLHPAWQQLWQQERARVAA